MAGHKKWFKVKRSKSAIRTERGKLSPTLGHEIAFDNNNDVFNDVHPNLIFPAGLLAGIFGDN